MKRFVLPIMLLLSIGSADAMWMRKAPKAAPTVSITPQTVQAAEHSSKTVASPAAEQPVAAATSAPMEEIALVEETPKGEVVEVEEIEPIEPLKAAEVSAVETAPSVQAPVAKQPVRLVPVTKPAAIAPAATAQERVLMWTVLPGINTSAAESEVTPAQAPVTKQPVRLVPVTKPAALPK